MVMPLKQYQANQHEDYDNGMAKQYCEDKGEQFIFTRSWTHLMWTIFPRSTVNTLKTISAA